MGFWNKILGEEEKPDDSELIAKIASIIDYFTLQDNGLETLVKGDYFIVLSKDYDVAISSKEYLENNNDDALAIVRLRDLEILAVFNSIKEETPNSPASYMATDMLANEVLEHISDKIK